MEETPLWGHLSKRMSPMKLLFELITHRQYLANGILK